MPSNAHSKFLKTIKRCESLVDSYKQLQAIDQANGVAVPTPKDIVRGAVVLAVAALDTYVTDAFSEKLVPYLQRYKPDDELIELLYKSGLDTKEALVLLGMERPYRRIRTLIENYYGSYTTQKFDVIDQIFRPYRLANVTENAARKSGKPSIKTSVGKLVERRHQIAHAGDYNRHGRIIDINEEQIAKRIKQLELLVTSMDEILCNRV
ncbi:HEPN domain-containing protein [uncultured Pseudomonas sp.]|uniref:HEPN domain-containing protein n=1 Tax=uncultured Pseudomonas sp. TaxID=114707 RepID=UPI0025FDA64E|nr:HEPN domain-containing protein [uncultured Pseudomonas sp.]